MANYKTGTRAGPRDQKTRQNCNERATELAIDGRQTRCGCHGVFAKLLRSQRRRGFCSAIWRLKNGLMPPYLQWSWGPTALAQWTIS